MTPKAVIPRHVAACVHSADRQERWAVWFWNRDEPTKQHRVDYQCGSWRCPKCKFYEKAVSFARIRDAIERVGREESYADGWVYIVATIDRNDYYRRENGKKWADVNQAYSELGTMQRKLFGFIGREWGDETRQETRRLKDGTSVVRYRRVLGNRWISVVEAHRSGWPHINIQFWCPELAAALRADHAERCQDPEIAEAVETARQCWRDKVPVPDHVRQKARRAILVQDKLRGMLERAGFGRQSTAEASRDPLAIAGYSVKLAGQHDAAVGEMAKITQAPTNAPVRFRRLRAGKRFLDPRRSNPEVTGCLVRRRRVADWQRTTEGDWRIFACNAPAAEHHAPAVARAVEAEQQLLDEEAEAAMRGGAPSPPIRHAYAGALESNLRTSERNAAVMSRRLAALDWARRKSACA